MSDSAPQPAGFLKTWSIAVRPWAYSASLLPVLLGSVLARYEGAELNWRWLAVTLTGVLTLHTVGNLINDCYDFKQGIDQAPGPASGAVVRGLISPAQARRAALLFLLAGIACGIYLIIEHGIVILILGLAGIFFAVGYTMPGVSLKHRGLGDLAIFFSFGLLPTLGSYWVQAGAFGWSPLLWSLPIALHTIGILHANNWRDIDNDTGRNCLTFAALLGPQWSARYYLFLLLSPFLMVVLYTGISFAVPAWPTQPIWTFLTFFSLPMAMHLAKSNLKEGKKNPERLNLLDIRTAKLQLCFGLLLVASFLIRIG